MPVFIPTPQEWARMSFYQRTRALRVAKAALAALEPPSPISGGVEGRVPVAVPPVAPPARPRPVVVGRAGNSGPARVKGSTPTPTSFGEEVRQQALRLAASTPPDHHAELHRFALLQAIR